MSIELLSIIQEAAEGADKAPLHLLVPSPLATASRAMQSGAEKYGAFDWRRTGLGREAVCAKVLRHVFAVLAGEENDPESGLPHMAHVLANAMVYEDCRERGLFRKLAVGDDLRGLDSHTLPDIGELPPGWTDKRDRLVRELTDALEDLPKAHDPDVIDRERSLKEWIAMAKGLDK